MILAIALVACLLIVIGTLSLNLHLKCCSPQQNSNLNFDKDIKVSDLPGMPVYGQSGQISHLNNNQLELLSNQSGRVYRYVVSVDADTEYLLINKDASLSDQKVTLTNLKIGDSITALANDDIKNKTSFLATQIKLVR